MTSGTDVVLVDGYVPVIDLALDAPSVSVRRDAVVRAVATACETSGFFSVTGHGVPEQAISTLETLARRFFAEPDHVKQLVASDPGDPLGRGYHPVLGMLESFGINRLGEAGATGDEILTSPNLWPTIPGLRDACLTYYRELSTLSIQIMRLLASALALPADWFDDKFDNHMTPLAINYYPPATGEASDDELWHDAHSDLGAVTLLYQDNGLGGLQILDLDKQWHDVAPVPGTFVVNLGRMMTRWTNDRWPSAVHRVVRPHPSQSHRDRMSIAFFFQPSAEAVVSCVPTCVDDDNPARYQDITSGDYYLSRMRRAFVRERIRQRPALGCCNGPVCKCRD